MKKIYLLLAITIVFTSCFKNLFRIESTHAWQIEKIKKLHDEKKTFVVHYSNDIKKMVDPALDSNQISGALDSYQSLKVKTSNFTYAEPDLKKGTHQYKHKHKKQLFSEVHLFINEEYKDQKMVSINKDNFLQLREYSTSWEDTILSYTGGVLTIAGFTFVILLFLAASGSISF
jgi:hypothetical protein